VAQSSPIKQTAFVQLNRVLCHSPFTAPTLKSLTVAAMTLLALSWLAAASVGGVAAYDPASTNATDALAATALTNLWEYAGEVGSGNCTSETAAQRQEW
jgi:hypothetical protein